MPANVLDPLPRLSRPEATRPGIGVVHLGLGAFFRAHGAIYISEAMTAAGGDWGIVGISLKSPGTRDKLVPQDCVYTALKQGPDGPCARIIDVVQDVLVAPEQPDRVMALLTAPQTRIVTLTVTEKGYCHDPATGTLDRTHPDIVHDLTQAVPRSAPGALTRALQARFQAGLRPFTVLSCDNLPHNGTLLRGLVLDMARQIDPALATWIEQEGRFPNSMVDRIVPATRTEDMDTVSRLTGRMDAAPVVHEPFRQWVIEDSFVDDQRPALDAVGVMLVDDVTPYERMKLRCLNGTHSALAYLGYLAGYQTIADTVADPAFARYVAGLWKTEILPVLPVPHGVDLDAYADSLLQRYRNPAIRHLTGQIAMDGSQKLPQRILATIGDAMAMGRPTPGLLLAIAAWMVYVGGVDEQGAAIRVKDPMAETLKTVSDGAEGPAKASALLRLQSIFPPDLAAAMEAGVVEAYVTLRSVGARRAVAGLVGTDKDSPAS